MFFKDIIGQEEIKQRLLRSVQTNHIAHAQLLCGPEGVGKLQLALAYARYIQCTDRQADDACGRCPSCVKYNKVMHPDLHFVFPVIRKSASTISEDFITEWRQFLLSHTYFSLREWLLYIGAENQQGGIFVKESDEIIRKLSVKPYESEYKVMIIWLPERMNDQTANKLLKMLEEPYEKTVFLLVSNEPEQMLGTILSRSQRINVRPIPELELQSALRSRFGISEGDSREIAHIANGNILRAMENLRLSEEKAYFFNLFINMMRMAYARRLKEMKLWSEEVAGLGRERQRNFLNYAQAMIRENFIRNLQVPELNYMNKQEAAFSERFSPFVNERNTPQIMEELSLAEQHIAQNANAKMVFFDLALKFIMLLKNA
ncbi:MAG: DNA polymerase III subunit delta' [Bacteroidales bacterium]